MQDQENPVEEVQQVAEVKNLPTKTKFTREQTKNFERNQKEMSKKRKINKEIESLSQTQIF